MRRIITVVQTALVLASWAVAGCAPAAEPAPPRSARTARPEPRPRPARAAEGEPCQRAADCQAGLQCLQQWCRHPSCSWSLACLRKLSAAYKQSNQGYEVQRWYRRLSAAPHRQDCLDMPKRIAFLFYNEPHRWKQLCGAPPVPKVTKVATKSNPFRINDQQIKASGVPVEEKKELHLKHQALPDLCKAWVDFTLTRPFQGWVIARVYEQYDCDAQRYKARRKDPSLEPKCKTRLYKTSDRRYIFLHDRGSKFSLNFYFSTPPEVCKKPNLGNKHYRTGCFCMGIDTSKIKLEWKDDPFLFYDEVKALARPRTEPPRVAPRPKPRRRLRHYRRHRRAVPRSGPRRNLGDLTD